MRGFFYKTSALLGAFLLCAFLWTGAIGTCEASEKAPKKPKSEKPKSEKPAEKPKSEKPKAEKAPKKPPKTPDRPPAKAGESPPHGDAPKAVFLNLKPLDVPILQEGKLMGYIGMTVTIEGISPEATQKLQEVGDKIRDRMLQDLWAAYAILWRPGFMPDEDVLKKLIERSINAMVGQDEIANVYMKDFYFRPNPAYQHTSY